MSDIESIWKRPTDIAAINQRHQNTLAQHLEMQVTEVGPDYLTASMPVDARTHQPLGILHGGASVALAESVGSLSANLALDTDHYAVGLDINANHIKMARSGLVYATARPRHLGRSTQVWTIDIVNESQQLVCTSRLTMAVMLKQ